MNETATKSFTDLAPFQLTAVSRLIEKSATLLIGKMGAGKTVTCLTAISALLDERKINRVLVLTTKKIALTVWKQEAASWKHLAHLNVSIAAGLDSSTLRRLQLIAPSAEIAVINYELVGWMCDEFDKTPLPFDAIVFDEITKVSPGSKVFKRLRRRMKNFCWRVGMTASPVSENYLKLFSIMHMLDDGQTFGSNFGNYKERYFYPLDYERHQWQLRETSAPQIAQQIKPFTHLMEDYRYKLPEISIISYPIHWGPFTKMQYRNLAKNFLLESDLSCVEAANAAVLQGKLHQFTQGFLYDDDETVLDYHASKLQALQAVCQSLKSQSQIIIVYWFREDLTIIEEALGRDNVVILGPKNTGQVVQDWNAGKVPYLAVHPRSAGHGLNLAAGGHVMVFYTLFWSKELDEQIIGRIWRTGQTHRVKVIRLVCEDGLDPIILKALDEKATFDQALCQHLDSL